MKSFMSRKMKIFLSVLAIISLTSYISAAIVLYNSDFKLSNYINKISVFYTLKKQKNMFPLLTWPMPISYGNRLPVKFLSRQKRKNREFRPVFSFSTPYGFGRQTASFLVAQQKSEPSGLERCAHFFPLEVLRGTGLLRFHHRELNIFTIIENLYME